MKLKKTARQIEAVQSAMEKKARKKQMILDRKSRESSVITTKVEESNGWIRSNFNSCKKNLKQRFFKKIRKISDDTVYPVTEAVPVDVLLNTPTPGEISNHCHEHTSVNQLFQVAEPVLVVDPVFIQITPPHSSSSDGFIAGNSGAEDVLEILVDAIVSEASELSDPELCSEADAQNESTSITSNSAGAFMTESVIIGVNAVSMEDYLNALENEREDAQAEAHAQIAELYQQLEDMKASHQAAEVARKLNLKKMLQQKQLRIATEKKAETDIAERDQIISNLNDHVAQLTGMYNHTERDYQILGSENSYLRFKLDTKTSEIQAACREGEAKRLADFDKLIKEYDFLLNINNFMEEEHQKMQLDIQNISNLSKEHTALVEGIQNSMESLRTSVKGFFDRNPYQKSAAPHNIVDLCQALLSINKDLVFTAASTTVKWRNAIKRIHSTSHNNRNHRATVKAMKWTIRDQKNKISNQRDKICNLEMDISSYEKLERIEAPLRLATQNYVKRWQELIEEPVCVNAQEITDQMTYWQKQAEMKYEALENLEATKTQFQRELDAARQNIESVTQESTWSDDQALRLEQAESVIRTIKEKEPGKWDTLVMKVYNVAVRRETMVNKAEMTADDDTTYGSWTDDNDNDDDEFF